MEKKKSYHVSVVSVYYWATGKVETWMLKAGRAVSQDLPQVAMRKVMEHVRVWVQGKTWESSRSEEFDSSEAEVNIVQKHSDYYTVTFDIEIGFASFMNIFFFKIF